jgi:serine/threonine protein kinase
LRIVWNGFRRHKKSYNKWNHRYCNQIGYRFGKQLGYGDYGSVYQSYWLDNEFKELSLAVRVINVTQNEQISQSKLIKVKLKN